jgi:acetyl-CoA carboxylase carboxyl transferase subunit beta
MFRLAERLRLPVVTFVDTPGASPDAPSEERGQAEAIAQSIQVMTSLRTPIVTVITGEGGSGGALAIAVGDVVLALENAIYSVISPEGCASILWRTSDAAQQAAVAMRLTAGEQAALGVVDRVVPEAGEGAHDAPAETAERLRDAIEGELERLTQVELDDLVDERYARYRRMGEFATTEEPRSKRRERRRISARIRSLLSSGRAVLGGESFTGPLPVEGLDDAQSAAPLGEEV